MRATKEGRYDAELRRILRGGGWLMGILRRNPRQVTPELFYKWVAEKGFREKWPGVRVVEETRLVTL
jgi:hypothetical protein